MISNPNFQTIQLLINTVFPVHKISSSIKKILFLTLIFFPGIVSASHSCDSLKDRMEMLFKSQFSLKEAEEIFAKYSELECTDKLLAYNFMGFAHYNASNFDKAKTFLVKGEKDFFDKKNDPFHFSINQLYTALILIVEKDFDSALYHLKKAENYALEFDDKYIEGSIYQNMGLLYVEIDQLKTAENYFDKAIDTGEIDTLNMAYIYQNLAFLNLKKNNVEKTTELINKTKAIWEELNYHKGKYLLSFIEAKLAIKKNEYEDALSYLEYGRAVYEVDNKLLLGENYLIEARIQDSLGNSAAMIIALENAILKSDDLSEEQLQKTIASLSNLKDDSKTNEVLAELVTKLKVQNGNQKSINRIRNRMIDSEFAKDDLTIKNQIKYLVLLSTLLLVTLLLFLRIRKQKSDIQHLNSDLKSSKAEIENQVNQLKQKNKELEQFAYVASHDLQSPLQTISSFAGLLKQRERSAESKQFLEIINQSAENMQAMISELLNHSTLDQKLNIQYINFKTLIESTLPNLEVQILEAKANIIVDNSCNEIIQCDKTLFINVIQNLISNSIRYCKEEEPPQITINTRKTNQEAIIQFSDNGIGINDKHKELIFEMFTRLKTKKVAGTGIGLSTCKKIIENHGGTISVESTLGVGSTFTIVLPFAENDEVVTEVDFASTKEKV